jgi:hypothetical protein
VSGDAPRLFDKGRRFRDARGTVLARRFSVLQKVAALAPLLLLAVCLPGQMMFRCRIDGTLRPACCCAPDGDTQDAGPVVKAQDCCDRQVVQSTRLTAVATSAAHRDLVQVATAAIVAAPFPSFASPIERPERAWQRHGPAREGLPIVLLKHAFLI